MSEKRTYKEGDIVFLKGCENTRRAYGYDRASDKYLRKVHIVDSNNCDCGCIKLKDVSVVWHADDLEPAKPEKDIKKVIKPVLFDEEQIIQGETS